MCQVSRRNRFIASIALGVVSTSAFPHWIEIVASIGSPVGNTSQIVQSLGLPYVTGAGSLGFCGQTVTGSGFTWRNGNPLFFPGWGISGGSTNNLGQSVFLRSNPSPQAICIDGTPVFTAGQVLNGFTISSFGNPGAMLMKPNQANTFTAYCSGSVPGPWSALVNFPPSGPAWLHEGWSYISYSPPYGNYTSISPGPSMSFSGNGQNVLVQDFAKDTSTNTNRNFLVSRMATPTQTVYAFTGLPAGSYGAYTGFKSFSINDFGAPVIAGTSSTRKFLIAGLQPVTSTLSDLDTVDGLSLAGGTCEWAEINSRFLVAHGWTGLPFVDRLYLGKYNVNNSSSMSYSRSMLTVGNSYKLCFPDGNLANGTCLFFVSPKLDDLGNLYAYASWQIGTNQVGSIIRISPAARCDFDDNYEVSAGDFSIFVQAFGSYPGDPNWNSRCDLDFDGEVGPSDYLEFVTYFGATACP